MVFRSLVFLAVLSACAQTGAAQDKKIVVSQDAWKAFQDYKTWIGSTGSGYFALSQNGDAWDSAGCPDVVCRGEGGKADALAGCARYSDGVPCIIFAHDRDIVVSYVLSQ